MQPNSQPTPADVAAVSAHLGEQPAPQPAPQPTQPEPQMQPAAPTPQPAPSQEPSDPFAQLFASEPAPVEAPAQPTQESAPVEMAQPTPQQAPQPEPQPTNDYQTYEEYMQSVVAGLPEAPAAPDPETINAEDPQAIKGFFDDLLSSAEKRFEANYARKQAIQNSEKRLWDEAMDKYGSLRNNKQLRDTVHAIRMGHFNRGIALTPTQAAEKLLESLNHERRAGAAGAQVVTTYEQVQPNGGGSGAPVPTNLDKQNTLEAVQTGGETALAEILDQQIKAGKTW